tara:strand:+ start:148 stop:354 length:207 start_codon:yes stop_codon:yes gene_type:complete
MSKDKYFMPDKEEVEDAIILAKNCSASDLVNLWRSASEDWDLESLSRLHTSLYKSGRINELIDEVVNN